MSPGVAAIFSLTLILLVAILVDRGAPNVLESLAFLVERTAAFTTAALRSCAKRLRARQRAIELANQERMLGARPKESLERVVSSHSSSAAA